MAEKREFSSWEPLLAAPLIKEFEGLRLESYRCPAGRWTIGYGHAGSEIRSGMRIEQEEAERMLSADLARLKLQLQRYINVPVSRGQFCALISFAFNIGPQAFKSSTLLRYLNAGKDDLVAKEFGRWIYAGGQQLDGLKRRRAAEAEAFRS